MIKKVLVLGERCTGTNYLNSLISKNFKSVELCYELGWKHQYINLFNLNLFKNKEYLIIFCFRNPIDWIGSLYYHHWHFDMSKYSGMSSFIKMEPKQIIDGILEIPQNYGTQTELHWERHPFTFKKPKNLCELRNWKNENFLNSSNLFENVMYLNYENFSKKPKEVITQINNKFLKETLGEFVNVSNYKGVEENGIYIPKKYETITYDDYKFIENNLNWELENKLGYTKEDLFGRFQKQSN